MRTLYLDCSMGAAGDMLGGALLELHPDPESFLARLNALLPPNVNVQKEAVNRCGIAGTHFAVSINGEEEDKVSVHSCGTENIQTLLSKLSLPEKVRTDVQNVYALLAEAESRVHGIPVSQIHFHEVGELDAAADIIGVCLLLFELSPGKIYASPVRTGFGTVRCAHGVLPVPAPAAAELLKGIPVYAGEYKGEFCTPTGAALLRYFVSEFSKTPLLTTERIGYGMGSRDMGTADCLRAFFGETPDDITEEIAVLCCNVDDQTPEGIGFATERLLEEGALDVFTTPAQMKKNRPGVLITCLCKKKDREKMVRMLFLHTTTLGVREEICRRYFLNRSTEMQKGVRIKKADGYGVHREKAEYDDLAEYALKNGISLQQAKDKILE